MADHRKSQIVKELVEQGRITIRPELRRGNYISGYAPSDNPTENYFAVYGKWSEIRRLEDAGCTTKSKSPHQQQGDQYKAYLANFDPVLLQELSDRTPQDIDVFAVHGRPSPVHALGLYHTGYPIEGTGGESLSYLVMSAAKRHPFDTAVKRLTNDTVPEYMEMKQIGRRVGEFLLVPVRRSMADAIKRAHPEAIEIEGDAATKLPVSVRSMQDIAARLHEDMRFVVPYNEPAPKTKEVLPPDETIAQGIKSQPLKAWIAELEPFATQFERYEQIGGGIATRLVLKMDAGLSDLVQCINSPVHCPDGKGFHIPSVSGGRQGQQVTCPISEATFATLITQWPHLQTNTKVQDLQPQLLRHIPTQINNDSTHKPRLRIEELRLARTEEDGHVQNWLVVTTPHMQRAEMFAFKLGIGADRQRPITHGVQQPAIMLLPVTASVTEALITQSKIPHDETPYASMEEMEAALRINVQERTLLSDLQVQEAPKVEALPAVKPAPRIDEDEIRQRAAKILSGATNTNNRLWMHHARHHPTKRGSKQKQEVVSIGIRLPGDQGKQFEDDLRATGFLDLTGREFRYIGDVGKKKLKLRVYRLKLQPQDVAAWQEIYASDTHWPRQPREDQPRHLFTLTDEKSRDCLHRLMGVGATHEKPEETAWRRLAVLANRGAIRCMQVRYSAKDIHQMGLVYDKQLQVVDGVTAAHLLLDPIIKDWQEIGPPVYLHPVDDDVKKLSSQTLRTAKMLGLVHDRVEEIKRGLKDFREWLDSHPPNEDGSVTLPYLVMPNPQKATLGHLVQAEQSNAAQGRGRLFPQTAYVLKGIPEVGKDTYLQPFTSTFLAQLAEHHGRLEPTNAEPVALSAVDKHLRSVYCPPVQDNEPRDPQAIANELELASQRKARRPLIERWFPLCRDNILYGQLRPGNVPPKFGDRPEHDRIGTQHGLAMHVKTRKQWSEQMLPMLETMQNAAFLEAPKDYVMPLGAVNPDTLKVQIDLAQATMNDATFKDADYYAQRIAKDTLSSFDRGNFQDVLANMIANAEQLPNGLKPLAAMLADLPTTASDEGLQQAAELINATKTQLREQVLTLREEHDDAHEKFNEAAQIARRDGMMQQAREPLFYVAGHDAGYTFTQLKALVEENFNARVRVPLTVMTYLPTNGPLKGEYGDQSMIDRLKNAPPMIHHTGHWAGKVARARTALCPTNVTREQFLVKATEIFMGPQRGIN